MIFSSSTLKIYFLDVNSYEKSFYFHHLKIPLFRVEVEFLFKIENLVLPPGCIGPTGWKLGQVKDDRLCQR
jgi:hypothetical protein